MNKSVKLLSVCFIVAVVCGPLLADDGWVSIFNGKDLTGWRASENEGVFSVKDGILIVHGKRSHLFYEGPVGGADFKNFEWKADVKTFPKANSGMYFHTEYQQTGWPNKGYEVQVNTSHRDRKKTGGLYGIEDVLDNAPSTDGEWFTQHIIVKGKRIKVMVNGEPTAKYIEPEGVTGGRKLSSGTVAIQGHDPGSIVHYKNIMIKPLDGGDWVDLFNGKDLKGWTQKNGTAKYEVKDGTILGTTVKGSPNSFLCTEKLYGDFALDFEVKVDSRLNSGVQIRSNSFKEYRDYRVHGYQVEIATNGTAGFIYDEARRKWLSKNRKNPAANAAFKDGQWNKYNVVCKGDSIKTWVNGVPVANVIDAMTKLGFIGLQVHGFGGNTPAIVQWRNIRIKGQATDPVIKAVVVTGGHGFEKEPFFEVFKGHDDISTVNVDVKNGAELFEDISNWDYDVIVLYNMSRDISAKQQANFKKLLDDGVGLFMTHHAMGAWNDWDEYRKIVGAKFFLKDAELDGKQWKRSLYKHGVDIKVRVEDKEHTITRGMKDFVIHDETYDKCWMAGDNHVLLSTDEPSSNKEICWVRSYGKARVCGLELGHDGKAYANANYRRLIAMGIRWCAGR